MSPYLLAGIVIVIAVVVMIIKNKKTSDSGEPDDAAPDKTDVSGYAKKPYIFSPAEYSFYKVLIMALGSQHTVLVKVRLADMINVQKGTPKWQSKFNRIAKKHADFVLCDPKTMVVRGVIELDDASHETEDRKERDDLVDAIYQTAGIPCVHIAAARDYNPQDVVARVMAVVK